MLLYFFFFFKQKTAYEWLISDWSSDVCSSDLKLALPQAGMRTRLSNLLPILSSPIDWDEIEQQYDEMVKYAAAMQSRTADPEAILLRFARAEVMHPTYK